MAELKPCPFCGGTDIRYSLKITGHFDVRYHAAMYCNKCHCYGARTLTGNVRHDNYKGRTEIEKNESIKAEAIEAWNKRAENEELEFTRKFIHEHGLEFELASAWNRRAKDEQEVG